MNILVISRGNGFGHAKRDMLLARALQRAGHEVTMASYASGLSRPTGTPAKVWNVC